MRAVETVGQTEAGETAPQRVAGEGGEAVTVGGVVEQVLRPESVVQRDQILSREQRFLARLVVVEVLNVDRKTGVERTIEHVGFGEAEGRATRAAAEL